MDLRETCQEITRLWVQWWECSQLVAMMEQEKVLAKERAKLIAAELAKGIGSVK